MKGKAIAYLPKFDVNWDMRTSDCDLLDDVIVKMMFGFDINCYIDYDSAVNFKLQCNCKKIQYGHQMLSWAIFKTKRKTETWIATYIPYIVVFVSSQYSQQLTE